MSLSEKSSLRNLFLTRRRALPPEEHEALSRACGKHLITLIESLASVPQVIAGYFPIKAELNVTRALAALTRHKHITALPRAIKGQKELLFYIWKEGDDLARDIHAIPSPLTHQETVTPDMIIVPLLAFDRSGVRLGYGAGYYDATLAKLRPVKSVIAKGVAFSLQEETSLPAEPHDAKLDFIVTEKEVIRA